jgi:hypothetical protein
MVVRRVVVPKRDVVFVRGVFEASDGVGFIFSLYGGDLTIVSSPSREAELDELLADLREEIGEGWVQYDAGATPAH